MLVANEEVLGPKCEFPDLKARIFLMLANSLQTYSNAVWILS